MKNLKFGLILLVVCMISAASLSYVIDKTKPAIRKTKESNAEKLQREVLPDAVSFVDVSETIKDAFDASGKPAGRVVFAKTRGYGGDIEVIIGINRKGEVAGIKILKHNETPGLGTKALAESFLKQFYGKKRENVKLKKDDAKNGKIDSITGATITSRAVTNAVRSALESAAGSY